MTPLNITIYPTILFYPQNLTGKLISTDFNINPLRSKSDHHLFSLYNIICLINHLAHEKKGNDHQRFNVSILRRICMSISWFKGFKRFVLTTGCQGETNYEQNLLSQKTT